MTNREPPNLRDPNSCSNCRHVVWDYEIHSMCCSRFIIKLTASTQTICDDYEPEAGEGGEHER